MNNRASNKHESAGSLSDISNDEDMEMFNNLGGLRRQNGIKPGEKAMEVDDSRKFHILDETDESDSDNKSFSCDSDVPDDEIERMLEEALDRKKRKADDAGLDEDDDENKQPFEERDKIVLIEKCQNHFDVLPEGWIQVTHNSGMPLYLHKNSRVCTLSKPYFLGPGSVRKHEMPLSAIPCLSYRRALDREHQQSQQQMNNVCRKPDVDQNQKDQEVVQNTDLDQNKDQDQNEVQNQHRNQCQKGNQEQKQGQGRQGKDPDQNQHRKKQTGCKKPLETPCAVASTIPNLPNARIETVTENNQLQNLKPDDVREYASKLFEFKTIKVMRFKSWSERRQFTKKRKHAKQLERPNLPAGTKLITFPIVHHEGHEGGGSGGGGGSVNKKEWIMNPNGKSYVCILHEYVQHALKKQPTYKFTELENAATPYAATVSINDMQYGVGYGTSKKYAKSEAARATLEILIPEMKSKITTDAKTGSTASKDPNQDLSFFDEIRIKDPRVAEFCAKTTEPSPHDILLTCLQRNFGLNDLEIVYQGNPLKNKKNQFTMTVGKHTSTVVCKNKRDGKQLASQEILQALHPHINSWGSLLRLYGNGSVKSFKEKKLEEQEITLLQSKAAVNSPNFAILDKLKLELGKLRDKRKEIRPIGVMIPGAEGLPRLSSSNLKNVDL